MTSIAMENPENQWRFIAGKSSNFLWAMASICFHGELLWGNPLTDVEVQLSSIILLPSGNLT